MKWCEVEIADRGYKDFRPMVLFRSENPNEEFQITFETDSSDMLLMASRINEWIGAE